jgi:hypothetical protein
MDYAVRSFEVFCSRSSSLIISISMSVDTNLTPTGLEVALAHRRELEAELERFDPRLVVFSRPNTFEAEGRAAWVLLSDDPDEPSEVCIEGRHRRLENPCLEEMLEVIDETEELVGTGRELRGC